MGNIRDDEFHGHEWFRRMVTLIYHYTRPDAPDILVSDGGSGFVVEVKGAWWLVTAGHIIKTLRETQAAGTLHHLIACDAWDKGHDGTGLPNVLGRIPERWHMLGDGDKLDLGAIELGPMVAAAMAEGKIIPVTEDEWGNAPDSFDFYLLLGTPDEMLKKTVVDQVPVAVEMARGIAEMEKIERPDYFEVTPHERFYGMFVRNEADDAREVKNIAGMSGGPIFGCKRTQDGLRTWAIAVQSGWFKSKKVIVADYLNTVVAMIESLPVNARP